MRNPFRRLGSPDPEAFLAELAGSHPGKSYNNSVDRYRDFRALFLETERGKRVLYELLSWGGMFRPSTRQGNFDTNETFYHEGERNIALKIMYTMNAEPKERPANAKARQQTD